MYREVRSFRRIFTCLKVYFPVCIVKKYTYIMQTPKIVNTCGQCDISDKSQAKIELLRSVRNCRLFAGCGETSVPDPERKAFAVFREIRRNVCPSDNQDQVLTVSGCAMHTGRNKINR